MNKHKSLIKFILFTVICAILGGLVSDLLYHLDTHTFGQNVSNFLITYSPHLLTVSVVVLLALTIYFYQKAKRLYAQNDIDDDASFDAIDHNLTTSMTISSLVFVLDFLFFGIFAAGISHMDNSNSAVLPCFIITLLVFVGSAFATLYLQTRTIQMTKLLYPNKKGDPLDVKFSKDWLDSCDEAEQYVIFRSAYTAFQTTQKCIIFLWVIAVFGALLFETGILPVFIVSVLWGVLIMSYTITSSKLEKSRLR